MCLIIIASVVGASAYGYAAWKWFNSLINEVAEARDREGVLWRLEYHIVQAVFVHMIIGAAAVPILWGLYH
tara:strand:- start:559 stop:771 length:213 start_codon:yes stop_codon:yes gene_type:complete